MQQISSFLERIDDDRDGQLKLDDVLKVCSMFTFVFVCLFIIQIRIVWIIETFCCWRQVFETIGTENVNLTGKQIDEIVDLISKEEYLENEEKIQKALAKSKELREQQEQEKLEQSAKVAEPVKTTETATRSDDEKHVLDAERTPTIESKVNIYSYVVVEPTPK